MTPLQAATSVKPSIAGIREWGERVWVRVEKGDKLGGHVHEGHWMGVDKNSKGARIYRPDSKTITIEQNVYTKDDGEPMDRLEGEDWTFEQEIEQDPQDPSFSQDPKAKAQQDASLNQPMPTPMSPQDQPSFPPKQHINPLDSLSPDNILFEGSKHIKRPSQQISDLTTGIGHTSSKPADPLVPLGIRLPPPASKPIVDKDEETDNGWTLVTIDQYPDEYALVLETADAKAIEPRTLTEARHHPDWLLWEKGIHKELETLQQAGTWVLVDKPNGANIVGSKWVFHAKKDAAGNIVRHKACLVTQGFSQVPGVDYFDTYTPIAKLASVCTILAMGAQLNLKMHQINIKEAYLNGELTDKEIIYMKQPPGYHAPGSPRKVCCLYKTLYSLKQSGHHWYQKLIYILINNLCFTQCEVDQAVFIKKQDSELTIIAVHVDDCTIAATTITTINHVKEGIHKFVEISDLGKLHWLLRIEIHWDCDPQTIHLSQRSYLDSIVQ
jgi:hypothetical protein